MENSKGVAVINSGIRTNYPKQEKVKYFYFHLEAPNGEIIAASEIYTQKHNVTELLAKYFPEFEVIDAS